MTHLVIFAKAPLSGFAKTRLIPALGAEGAAALAQRMLDYTLAQALAAGVQSVELCMNPAPLDPVWQHIPLPQAVEQTYQGDGDLGARMNRAVERILARQPGSVLVIGTDCPALTAAQLLEAARQLENHDAVLIPAADGGYVLIGLRAACAGLFVDMAWSTPAVAFETLRRMERLGLRVWKGPVMHDIDEPGDLVHLPEALKSRPF